MQQGSLYNTLAAVAGASPGQYRGAETIADFGDVEREFAALRDGCGVFDLGWRSKFVVTGDDRVRWINGMVTNNIRDLELGHGAYCFLLNAQGRILGDLYCFNRGQYMLIETDAAQAQNLRELLERYIIMDDVKLTDISPRLVSIGLQGPRAAEVLREAGIAAAELQPLEVKDLAWNEIPLSLVRLDAPATAFELWIPAEHAGAVWNALVGAGATPVGSSAYELMRIALGVPAYGQDITERYLPQETEQQRALNFTKGCYVGQEIVERIRSRGLVHRQLTRFTIDGPAPTPRAKIHMGEREVGEITSAAEIPQAKGTETVALGYLRREAFAAPDLQVNGLNVRVSAETPQPSDLVGSSTKSHG